MAFHRRRGRKLWRIGGDDGKSAAHHYERLSCGDLRRHRTRSVRDGALDRLARRLTGPESQFFADRIRAAYAGFQQRQYRDDLSNAEFDTICLGEALPQRPLDPRVVRAMAKIGKFCGEPVTAASCAAEAGLSPSRFLHLFKEETGISFRSFRAWKRARRSLHFANQDINLAHLAQDIGYPDSTHFSHSIRRFYGLKPRAIFSGSRDLAIYSSEQAGAKPHSPRVVPGERRDPYRVIYQFGLSGSHLRQPRAGVMGPGARWDDTNCSSVPWVTSPRRTF